MKTVSKNLTVWYDKEGDFLEFSVGKPVKGVYRPVGNECFERIEEETGKVVGFAIFSFLKRFPEEHADIVLPVEMTLKTVLKA